MYYLGDEQLTLYRFDKRKKYTQSFSYEDTNLGTYIREAFFLGDILVLVGEHNAYVKINGDVALFFDTINKKYVNELMADRIERQGHLLMAKQTELVINNGGSGINDNNKYYAYIEHYDFRGNLINGKTIRGKGSIGKYQIEMSMHCLSGQISGWYKYKGHTNYMTIKGTITDNDYFNFVEYNDKGERFGTFTGYADFESQTLSGSFHKGSVELDFRISPYEMW